MINKILILIFNLVLTTILDLVIWKDVQGFYL